MEREETSTRAEPMMRDLMSLMLYVVVLSIVLVTGLSMVQFYTVTSSNEYLKDMASATFTAASASVVKAYTMPFYAELMQILPVLTAFTVRSLTNPQASSSEPWHEWWVERFLITQKLNPHATLFRLSLFLPEGLLLSQHLDGCRFTVVNFTSNVAAVYNVTTITPMILDLLSVGEPQPGLLTQWTALWQHPPSDLRVILDTDNELTVVSGTPFTDNRGNRRGLLVGTTAISLLSNIIQPMQFPFSQTIDITLVSSQNEILATTFTRMPLECPEDTPFAHCISIDNNKTMKCLHTIRSFASIYSLPEEILTLYPNVEASKTRSDPKQIFQFTTSAFPFTARSGRSYLVSLPGTYGVTSLFVAASDIVLQDYSQLLTDTARTVLAVAIVFGAVMALLQFGVLVAVRRVVSKMMDACATALDGVVSGRETVHDSKNFPSFLRYFAETSHLVDANASLDSLVHSLMTALPSKEAPSALRRVRAQPEDAEVNPLTPLGRTVPRQMVSLSETAPVASTLLFHMGSLPLLHRDDERTYCHVMSSALSLVHESGGVLERVGGGYFVASFNCHWSCEHHAEVATHVALRIHQLMQDHLAVRGPDGPGQSSTLFQALAVGRDYCLIVDCAPFVLHEFEQIGRTPEKTMRSSVVYSTSDDLLMRLAPLVSALRFRVVVTSDVAHRIDIATCVIDSVVTNERSVRLYEICDDGSLGEVEQATILRGFAEMHAGRYEDARDFWQQNPPEYRRGERLVRICNDMIRTAQTGTRPPIPYRRCERPLWDLCAQLGENDTSLRNGTTGELMK